MVLYSHPICDGSYYKDFKGLFSHKLDEVSLDLPYEEWTFLKSEVAKKVGLVLFNSRYCIYQLNDLDRHQLWKSLSVLALHGKCVQCLTKIKNYYPWSQIQYDLVEKVISRYCPFKVIRTFKVREQVKFIILNLHIFILSVFLTVHVVPMHIAHIYTLPQP